MLLAINCGFPSALYIVSLLDVILITLSSQKAIKLILLWNNFWILPNVGFKSLVVFSAIINWFKSFTLELELYIPEYIKPWALCSSSYISWVVVEALTPLVIYIELKSSLILLDSIPFPKEKQLYQESPAIKFSPIFSLNLSSVSWSLIKPSGT